MLPRSTRKRYPTRSYPEGSGFLEVALEAPLQLLLGSQSSGEWLRLGTILRTPGSDYELALGYLHSLELITSRRELTQLSYCSESQDYNTLKATFREGIPERARQLRNQDLIHAGCGACGQDRLALEPSRPVERLASGHPLWAGLLDLSEQLRQHQPNFARTGGVHAAAALDPEGNWLETHEDVGRHNAVDKVVGALMMADRLPAPQHWLLLSGRAGYELVHKAVLAGFSAVASLGPPSSLAIDYAKQAGLTLVGFLNAERYHCYTS